jgi:hypothetical protein
MGEVGKFIAIAVVAVLGFFVFVLGHELQIVKQDLAECGAFRCAPGEEFMEEPVCIPLHTDGSGEGGGDG